jgi:hypothetical protein
MHSKEAIKPKPGIAMTVHGGPAVVELCLPFPVYSSSTNYVYKTVAVEITQLGKPISQAVVNNQAACGVDNGSSMEYVTLRSGIPTDKIVIPIVILVTDWDNRISKESMGGVGTDITQ